MGKTIYTVRITEAGKFRDITFDNEQKMLRFKEMAEEDGSYWGIYTERKGENHDS